MCGDRQEKVSWGKERGQAELTYSADGLLSTKKDGRGNQYAYSYDAQGRLIRDDDPATGFKTLARTDQATGWTVNTATALNRTSSFQVNNLSTGELRQTDTDASGLVTTRRFFNTLGFSFFTAPDGTQTNTVETGDPRWGMQAPVLKSLSVQLPSGLTSSLSSTRAVTVLKPKCDAVIEYCPGVRPGAS